MAYLPFYITPEKFQEYQQQLVKSIEYTPGVTSWMCKNVEHNYRFFRAIFWVIPVLVTTIIIGGIMTFGSSGPVWYISNPDIYLLIVPLIIGGWAGYLSYGIDDRYDYTLSSAGLIYQKRLDEPLWGPRFVQIMAYFGCIGCLFAVVIAGPLILVGSGGFLLLAFASTKKREIHVEEWIIPSDQFVYAREYKKRKVICLYATKENCEYSPRATTAHKINRTQNRGDFFLFYKTNEEYEKITSILSQKLGIRIEAVNDSSHIFVFEQWPQQVIDLLMFSEQYCSEDIISRSESDRPKGETQEEVNQRYERLYGNL
ncbi:hypothetical protein M9194_06635 [Vibrio sp. S4M6]|uniref:hypothetical protein n=1 Tax=Vibrio sinus TaxID=2946865 RepID=UPI00202A3FF4|nr:hypothetical protein [Vibrio sinus]MCL9781100.1 hypothetical protein [Vibrio sinus]